jgi:hypothetical protein
MRVASLVPVVVLALLSAPAHSDPPNVGSSANTQSNEADWADWDARARITEGDYDGAVQAEQRAKEARQQADHVLVRAPSAPPSVTPEIRATRGRPSDD